MNVLTAAALLLTVMAGPLRAQSAVSMPSFTGPVTGPGPLYTGVMDLPNEGDLERLGYTAKEYFVSGTASGAPYTTRIVVRQPTDSRRFSGIVVAEAMHPSGYSWMFAFNRAYVMGEGHVSVEIVTAPGPVPRANPERYEALRVAPEQANEVIAQVGALLKSNPANGPLGALRARRLILMGTSASARILTNYLPAHPMLRLPNMGPIYDGFLPTSIGGNDVMPRVDVPVIQMPTMTEVAAGAEAGNKYRRPDGDRPGDQFRIYEVAGMSHNDSRDNQTYMPDPCRYPVSRFPEGAGMSVGLHHLIAWVDKGTVAPRAEYIAVDNDTGNDGSPMALDAHGNAKGGIRTTYVDVPIRKYGVPNEANPEPIANPSSHVRARQDGAAFYCRIAGYELPLPAEQVKALYRSRQDYQQKVQRRLDELTKQGWFMPAYRGVVLADAAGAVLPGMVTAIPGVVAEGASWALAWQGTDNADGLVGTADGGVLFAQEQSSRVSKLDPAGKVSVFVEQTRGAGSLAIDAQGRLLAVQRTCTDPGLQAPCTEPTAIGIIHPESGRKTLADQVNGRPLGRLNDLVVSRRDDVYFTSGGAFHLDPAGKVRPIGESLRTNGIMLSPDETVLYVTNGAAVVAFDVQPDGTVHHQREFAKLAAGGTGDGLAVDAAGRLYVTSMASGVQVFSPAGKYLGVLPTPRRVISVAFAGPGKTTLYVVGSGALNPDGTEVTTPPGVRNNAKSIYRLPMLAQGFTGRAK